MARRSSVEGMLRQAGGMSYGFERTALIEQAVRQADSDGDLDASFRARERLAGSAQHGGEPHKALVAITWCLGQIDAHPGRFSVSSTYWALKWLPHSLVRLPDTPLAEIERVVAEVERRYRAEGTGEDAIAKLAWEVPLRTGRVDEAVAAHRRWRLLPRSSYSDCRACDVSEQARLALATGEPERALDTARPLLAGRLDCAEEPHIALGLLLEPLLALGRSDEAERLHTWGARLSRGNPSLLTTQAQHVAHLVRTSRTEEAADWLVELLQVCDRGIFDAGAQMRVQAVGAAVASSLADAGVALLPRDPGARPRATGELAQLLAGQARATAQAFARRNGNDRAVDEVEALIATRPSTVVPGGPAAPGPHAAGETAGVEAGEEAGAGAAKATPPATDAPEPPADADELLARARDTPGLELEDRLALVEQALARAGADGDALTAARARRTRAGLRLRLGHDDAVEELEQAVAALGEAPVEQMRGALLRARISRGTDEDPSRWLALAHDAAERAPEPGLARGECLVLDAESEMLAAEDDAARDRAALRYEQARTLLRSEPERVVDAWASEGWSRGAVGDLDGALEAKTTAWELARDRGDDESVTELGEDLAALLAHLRRPAPADEVLVEVQAAHLRLRSRGAAGRAALRRSDLAGGAGQGEQSLTLAFEAADLLASAGDPGGAAWARLAAGRAFRAIGADQSAFDLWSELVEQARDDGDTRLEGAVALDLATLDADYDDTDEALHNAERALGCFGPDEPGARARISRLLARVHAQAGDEPAALAAGADAVSGFAVADDPYMLARAQAEQADRLVLAGRGEEGLALYEAARERFEAEHHHRGVGSIDLGRADALASLGRTAEAVALAEEVAELGRRLEADALTADALWVAASHSGEDARYELALLAYEQAGAPPEQLAALREQRDTAREGR